MEGDPTSAATKVLIADDEPFNLDLLTQELGILGNEVVTAVDGQEALTKIDYGFPGIVVTDIRMPNLDGLELMAHVRRIDPDLPVILVSAHGDIAMAVQAMRDGAYDFLERPYEADRLREMAMRALRQRSLVLDNRALRAELRAKSGLDSRLLGNSPPMEELRRIIVQIADTGANVLIRGETGTGKELVARGIHDLSGRRQRRFVPVNCAATPETLFESELFGHEAGAFTGAAKRRIGRFEYADGGTLFLDEIESMPLSVQVKLLRVLQERKIERLGSNQQIPVDFRVVAATQIDLREAIDEGQFRKDLYFRLNVAEIHVPPLSERREDIPLLFQSFVHELAAAHERDATEPTVDDLQEMMSHGWPGNVRELRNVAVRHVLGLRRGGGSAGELIQPPDRERLSLAQQVEAFERCILDQELAKNGGNIQDTAESLDMPTRTLNDRMRRHGLTRKDYL